MAVVRSVANWLAAAVAVAGLLLTKPCQLARLSELVSLAVPPLESITEEPVSVSPAVITFELIEEPSAVAVKVTGSGGSVVTVTLPLSVAVGSTAPVMVVPLSARASAETVPLPNTPAPLKFVAEPIWSISAKK
jgi:hypothetical protein